MISSHNVSIGFGETENLQTALLTILRGLEVRRLKFRATSILHSLLDGRDVPGASLVYAS